MIISIFPPRAWTAAWKANSCCCASDGALQHAVALSRYFLRRKKQVQKYSSIYDGLPGADKAQQCGFITYTSFLGGHPCISSRANRLWGAGFLLTSFSQLQSKHLGLGYHLTPLCNQQAKTGTSRYKFIPLEARWEEWSSRDACLP